MSNNTSEVSFEEDSTTPVQRTIIDDVKSQFTKYFKFNDTQPEVFYSKLFQQNATSYADFLVNQQDRVDTAPTFVEKGKKLVSILKNTDQNIIPFLDSIDKFKTLYDKNNDFKTLVDFLKKKKIYEKIQANFNSLLDQNCKTISSTTWYHYINWYLLFSRIY